MRSAIVVVAIAAMMAGVAHAADVFNMTNGQTSLQFVTVDNPGNAADTTGYGAVGYAYQMGKYDVTNAQYAEFLTAKASGGDPYGLWNSYMGSDAEGGITRSGSGPYTYSVKTGQENQPVVDVTWYDTIRFANWLTNGQGGGNTESGTYAITNSGPNWTVAVPSASQRAAWAAGGEVHYLLPSQDEWYKAAYYKGGGKNAGYWLYPTQSDTAPISQAPLGGSNSANFYSSTTGYAVTQSTTYSSSQNYLTDVGAYPNSLGPYGTLDQGGDVWQWNEADIYGNGLYRSLRGGSWNIPTYSTCDLISSVSGYDNSQNAFRDIGFRVASVGVPEPGSIAMVIVGGLCLSAYAWRRRRA